MHNTNAQNNTLQRVQTYPRPFTNTRTHTHTHTHIHTHTYTHTNIFYHSSINASIHTYIESLTCSATVYISFRIY